MHNTDMTVDTIKISTQGFLKTIALSPDIFVCVCGGEGGGGVVYSFI